MRTKKYRWALFYIMPLLFIFTSCIEDVTESTKEPIRYTANDIKSYSDLFNLFWTIMNQKYNYFNEQSGMDWEAVYQEYAPKFEQLKAFNRDQIYSKAEISEDCNKAIEYFTEIVDPIIDRHFYVKISLPVSQSYTRSVYFYGGMKNKKTIYTYPFVAKYEYMKAKINIETAVLGRQDDVLGGFLSDNPDIYYFSFKSFMLSKDYMLSFKKEYLAIDNKSPYYLSEEEIRDTIETIQIQDLAVKNILIEKSIEYVKKFNSFMESEAAQSAINRIAEFNQSENIDNRFIEALSTAKIKAPNMNKELVQLSILKEFRSNPNYTKWFIQRSTEHLQLACEYPVFLSDIDKAITNQHKIDFYKNFLVPLKEGKIKKIILDFRGNGGGMVLDARTFTDRFITKNAIFGYQRFKEDNNPFSYTPWVPCMTKTTDIGIRKEIPIVVLIDKNSASMSEISTLMLKSQGKHVTVVGHYSSGATAGLGDSDQFNGGLRGQVGGYLEFYMPLLAMQDATQTVIEGIGIKPDILMDALTEAEVDEMSDSPDTHIDYTVEQAVNLLKNN
ncbi:MAG: S41 family peptidase [Bacteroides sp.]|uniref:S41 family peptidase n=1 Tax=Bacteroides sp. TaxID=29523 RepID=UPI002FC88F61